MTLREFLSERLHRVILWLAVLFTAAAFLAASGTQTGVLMLLLPVLLLLFLLVQIYDFLRERARLEELDAIWKGLDKKYLFAECVTPPQGCFERRLFDLMRRSGKAMIGAVSEAEAAQREYREYIEIWVHEIKTPITAARLVSQNADSVLRRKLHTELSQVEAHVERALFYARAESPERDCLIRQTDLSEIVDQAVREHRSLLIPNGVRIEKNDLTYSVYTDEKWAVFIVGQLLQNAVRYRSSNPLLTISARPLGRQVQLSVSDNGIGIPSHELPRIFDRGFTGSNGRFRGGSTGMGLYLCRKLTAFLEADVQVQSVEGQGTCVTVTFPANLSKI